MSGPTIPEMLLVDDAEAFIDEPPAEPTDYSGPIPPEDER